MAEHLNHAEVMAALVQELDQQITTESMATTIAQRAVEFLPQADCVSLTVRTRRDRYETLASSNDLSRRADELQYTLKEGPCVEAAEGHDFYRSGDVGRDPRWPRWGPRAEEVGIRSLLSVRMLTSGVPTGALNFYSFTLSQFDDSEQIALATLFATHAAITLSTRRQTSGLQTALHTRHVIGFAQGILAERYGLDMNRSFDLLRRYSSVTNTKLADLAEQIVLTRRLPSAPDDESTRIT